MLVHVNFLKNQLFLCFFLSFNLLQQGHDPRPFLRVMLKICSQFLFHVIQVLYLLFQKLGEFFLAAVMFIDKSSLDQRKDSVQLICTLFVTS